MLIRKIVKFTMTPIEIRRGKKSYYFDYHDYNKKPIWLLGSGKTPKNIPEWAREYFLFWLWYMTNNPDSLSEEHLSISGEFLTTVHK